MTRIELGHVPAPRVVCRGWETSRGVRMACLLPYIQPGHPGAGEVVGQCATCGEQERRARVVRRFREQRAFERRRERGYGPAPAGTDPFRGFREGAVDEEQ